MKLEGLGWVGPKDQAFGFGCRKVATEELDYALACDRFRLLDDLLVFFN